MGKYKKKKVGVAGLKPTRYDNSKGTRIGPSLFNTSKLYKNILKNDKTKSQRNTIIHIRLLIKQ